MDHKANPIKKSKSTIRSHYLRSTPIKPPKKQATTVHSTSPLLKNLNFEREKRKQSILRANRSKKHSQKDCDRLPLIKISKLLDEWNNIKSSFEANRCSFSNSCVAFHSNRSASYNSNHKHEQLHTEDITIRNEPHIQCVREFTIRTNFIQNQNKRKTPEIEIRKVSQDSLNLSSRCKLAKLYKSNNNDKLSDSINTNDSIHAKSIKLQLITMKDKCNICDDNYTVGSNISTHGKALPMSKISEPSRGRGLNIKMKPV